MKEKFNSFLSTVIDYGDGVVKTNGFNRPFFVIMPWIFSILSNLIMSYHQGGAFTFVCSLVDVTFYALLIGFLVPITETPYTKKDLDNLNTVFRWVVFATFFAAVIQLFSLHHMFDWVFGTLANILFIVGIFCMRGMRKV